MQIQQKEKKRAKYRVSFIFLFIFASFAICFNFYMKEDFDAAESVMKREPEFITEAPEAVRTEENENVNRIINPVQLSDKADSAYFNTAAFIGGDQLKGLSDYGIIPKSNIFADNDFSVRSAGVDDEGNPLSYEPIEKFIREGRFGAVYFMAGINDLGSGEEGLFSGLDGIIDGVREYSPDTKLYFVSLLPITAAYERDELTNINIDTYNTAFLRFANSKNVYYLDLNTAFVGNDGKMPDSLAEPGGIRLKKDAYDRIGEYLLTHIGK